MTEAHPRFKLNIFHDTRNHDIDVSEIEARIPKYFNYNKEYVKEIDIRVGYQASGVFVVIESGRWSTTRVERMIDKLTRLLERYQYADNIREKKSDRLVDAVIKE